MCLDTPALKPRGFTCCLPAVNTPAYWNNSNSCSRQKHSFVYPAAGITSRHKPLHLHYTPKTVLLQQKSTVGAQIFFALKPICA